jgi:hypothetical protein
LPVLEGSGMEISGKGLKQCLAAADIPFDKMGEVTEMNFDQHPLGSTERTYSAADTFFLAVAYLRATDKDHAECVLPNVMPPPGVLPVPDGTPADSITPSGGCKCCHLHLIWRIRPGMKEVTGKAGCS